MDLGPLNAYRTLILSKADAMAAVEYWLNNCVLKEPVSVTHIEQENSANHHYKVRMETNAVPMLDED